MIVGLVEQICQIEGQSREVVCRIYGGVDFSQQSFQLVYQLLLWRGLGVKGLQLANEGPRGREGGEGACMKLRHVHSRQARHCGNLRQKDWPQHRQRGFHTRRRVSVSDTAHQPMISPHNQPALLRGLGTRCLRTMMNKLFQTSVLFNLVLPAKMSGTLFPALGRSLASTRSRLMP